MRKLRVINGKRMRAPSYDDRIMREQPAGTVQDVSSPFDVGFGIEREYPSTHDRDRDLLIALGVDGTVPLAQARVNAGLHPLWNGYPFAANDNHELAAQAA